MFFNTLHIVALIQLLAEYLPQTEAREVMFCPVVLNAVGGVAGREVSERLEIWIPLILHIVLVETI